MGRFSSGGQVADRRTGDLGVVLGVTHTTGSVLYRVQFPTASRYVPEDRLDAASLDPVDRLCGDVFRRFLGDYLNDGILTADPFLILDDTVRGLVARCVSELREAKPDLQIGLCGEQAGNRDTVAFCIGLGINSVSVSPAMIPVTLLRAAQHALGAPSAGSSPVG